MHVSLVRDLSADLLPQAFTPVTSTGNDCLACSRFAGTKHLLLNEEADQLFQWEPIPSGI